MEWIKEKPPLEKEKSDKQINKQIDQNAKATTNLLEKVRKYRCSITVKYQIVIEVPLKFQRTFMLMIRSHHFLPNNYFRNQGI